MILTDFDDVYDYDFVIAREVGTPTLKYPTFFIWNSLVANFERLKRSNKSKFETFKVGHQTIPYKKSWIFSDILELVCSWCANCQLHGHGNIVCYFPCYFLIISIIMTYIGFLKNITSKKTMSAHWPEW